MEGSVKIKRRIIKEYGKGKGNGLLVLGIAGRSKQVRLETRLLLVVIENYGHYLF